MKNLLIISLFFGQPVFAQNLLSDKVDVSNSVPAVIVDTCYKYDESLKTDQVFELCKKELASAKTILMNKGASILKIEECAPSSCYKQGSPDFPGAKGRVSFLK